MRFDPKSWTRLAKVQKAADTLVFDMPSDQDWPEDFWERIGVGPEWDKFNADMAAAGGTMDDTEDIVIDCLPENRHRVMGLIQAAQAGQYGPDVQLYWQSARLHRRRATDDGLRAMLLYLYGETPWVVHKMCGEKSMKRDGFGYDLQPTSNSRREKCRICHSEHIPTSNY